MAKHTIKIAIDGPAGAGKTTIAKLLAEYLDYLYVDTGAMYRAVALKALATDVDPTSATAIEKMLENTDITVVHEMGSQRVILDGMDVSDQIRAVYVATAASDVGVHACVRNTLVEKQRALAADHNVVMDGRDIGTYVLPHADIKIFLTATTDDRAMRRYLELQAKGSTTTFEQVMKDLKYRDRNDSSRAIAPLMIASDALIVDTSDNTLEQSIIVLKEIIQEKLYDIIQHRQALD